jgi:hypothetical protein
MEKIQTQHPQGKKGVNISRAKYDQMRDAIEAVLREAGALTATEISDRVEERLAGRFEGSIRWYSVTVKQDLEARGVIAARPKTKPPHWYWVPE